MVVERLHLKIDALMARLPIKGIPEKGYIPSRLKYASPLTHERLYDDQLSEPTVLTSCVRIMLTMQKSEATILLQKSFLGRADSKSEQEQKMWNRYAGPCVVNLTLKPHHLQMDRLGGTYADFISLAQSGVVLSILVISFSLRAFLPLPLTLGFVRHATRH